MGTSYEGALVMGEVAEVAVALDAAGMAGIVAPVGPGRTAVLPREGAYKVADVDELGAHLSGACGFNVLVHTLFDSDLLSLYVYQGGEPVHVYHSEAALLGTPFEDENGEMKVELHGVLYAMDDESLPRGPQGADPAVIASFACGVVDVEKLGAVLRGEGLDPEVLLLTERRHWVLAAAMNLSPAPLTEAYRHADVSDYPGAVLVGG